MEEDMIFCRQFSDTRLLREKTRSTGEKTRANGGMKFLLKRFIYLATLIIRRINLCRMTTGVLFRMPSARLLSFLLLLLPFTSRALVNSDSLLAVLNRQEPDSALLEKYLAKAADMGGDDVTAVKVICNWAYEKSRELNIRQVQVHALYGIGRAYLITDDYDPATLYLNQALKLAQQYNLPTTEASCYTSFGNIYSANRQFDEATRNYKMAIDLYRKAGDSANVATVSFNLASQILEADADSNAARDGMHYLDIALSMINEKSNPDVYVNAIGMKGWLYSNAGRYDSAAWLLAEAQRVIESKGYDEYRPQIFYYGGYHLLNMHRYNEAAAYFNNGLSLGRKMNSMFWVYNFYDALSRVYAAEGNYEKSLAYYKNYKAAYDSLVNAENFNKVIDLRHLYENEKNEKEMLETRRAKTISDLRLETEKRRRNNLLLLAGGLFLAIVAFAFLIVRLRSNISERKKAYARLEEKNTEIRQQSEKLVQQSKEIARYQSQMNPHFVFNALNSIQGHVMGDDKDKTIHQLQRFSRLMRQTLNNSDLELISLRVEFDFLRLFFDFEKERFEKTITLQLVASTDPDDTYLPPMLIQPFIENSLKHAGLDSVADPVIRVQAEQVGPLLKITVTDNGIGIRQSPTSGMAHPHATDIVQSRLRLLFENQQVPMPSPFFRIEAARDFSSGTSVSFFLPLINRF